MSKKGKTSFHNMTMTTLNKPILFTSMGTRAAVNDAKLREERRKRTKFPSPIGLNTLQFSVMLALNHGGKSSKRGINIRFIRQGIKPHVPSVMINT